MVTCRDKGCTTDLRLLSIIVFLCSPSVPTQISVAQSCDTHMVLG